MTAAQKLQMAFDISDLAHALRKAGIRRDHPDWTDRQVIIELLRQAFLPDPLPSWVK
jgi:Rv0078B-related antitoxin